MNKAVLQSRVALATCTCTNTCTWDFPDVINSALQRIRYRKNNLVPASGLHCGSKKNAPTLADYNCDPVQSILISFSKLFVNDHKSCLVVKFSTSPHICCHYTVYLVKHNALFCTNFTAYRKKCAISRQSSASSTRPVAAKQPGPKASRLPHLGPDAAASVQDAGP